MQEAVDGWSDRYGSHAISARDQSLKLWEGCYYPKLFHRWYVTAFEAQVEDAQE